MGSSTMIQQIFSYPRTLTRIWIKTKSYDLCINLTVLQIFHYSIYTHSNFIAIVERTNVKATLSFSQFRQSQGDVLLDGPKQRLIIASTVFEKLSFRNTKQKYYKGKANQRYSLLLNPLANVIYQLLTEWKLVSNSCQIG